MQFNIRNAKRHSAAQAFLVPALSRKNLTVITHAHIHNIVIEKDEARGVSFRVRGDAVQSAFAEKEVILSAGAFGSPHILMLSGIGSREELQVHNITVKKDLPGVGKNLQDHLFFPVSSLCRKPISSNRWIPAHKQAQALLQYLFLKKGPLTTGPLEANAFVRSAPSLDRPDIQLQFTPTHAGDDYATNIFDLSTFPHTDGYTVLPTQMRPLSRGYVSLQSSDPYATPRIDPRYLEAEEDRKTLVAGCKIALNILDANAFEEYRIRTHCPAQRSSDDEILRHIRQSAECVYHPVGTCSMGTTGLSVVDARLNVRGIGKLRVADASVMPVISSGNTNAPVIMIAEKAADMIKADAAKIS